MLDSVTFRFFPVEQNINKLLQRTISLENLRFSDILVGCDDLGFQIKQNL